ncbi:hypothetical protein FQA47_005389 [Oryzias melastigma]|uniref:Uncharacterized protein n=1 Tax=Oryzias melastigma TaxID=30732 RepID=A0A834CNH4_ORYME|nr:hypothetical protein FQA47_005389 [Oryzias melastigma]
MSDKHLSVFEVLLNKTTRQTTTTGTQRLRRQSSCSELTARQQVKPVHQSLLHTSAHVHTEHNSREGGGREQTEPGRKSLGINTSHDPPAPPPPVVVGELRDGTKEMRRQGKAITVEEEEGDVTTMTDSRLNQ